MVALAMEIAGDALISSAIVFELILPVFPASRGDIAVAPRAIMPKTTVYK